MPGIAELALGAAPIAGGALLGVAAGNLKPPDVRGLIKQGHGPAGTDPRTTSPNDRPGCRRSIDQRIDELIIAGETQP